MLFVRDIRQLAGVRRTANADVRVHLLHLLPLEPTDLLQPLPRRRLVQGPQDAVVLPAYQRYGTPFGGTTHKLADQGLIRQIECLDQHPVSLAELTAVFNQYAGQCVNPWILHRQSPSRSQREMFVTSEQKTGTMPGTAPVASFRNVSPLSRAG